MLETIAIVLFILWILGLITHVGGALIHILLVLVLLSFVVKIVRGRSIL